MKSWQSEFSIQNKMTNGESFKDKKSSGCALHHGPYKYGREPKNKKSERFMAKVAEKEIQGFYKNSDAIAMDLFWAGT